MFAVKSANKDALAAFNCLLTVVGSGVFAYFATGLIVENNVITQILVAIIVSAIVAVADVYFLIKKLHYDEVKAAGIGKQRVFLYHNTRVTLKIIHTPLAFWTLGEMKNPVHSKVKKEDWNGRKREKVGQLCPSTETGAVQG